MSLSFFKKLESELTIRNNNHWVVVPLANNNAVEYAINEALNKKLIKGATLVGNVKELKKIFKDNTNQIKYIEANSEAEALEKSINEIKNSNADILMKGMCQSASLIKAVLDKNNGINHNFVSHITCFQLPDRPNFCLLTDSAVNISPDDENLIKIINNAYDLFQKLSDAKPMVALLAANEKITDKMPSTKLAESVVSKLSSQNDYIVEGPVAFDLAVSSKSAQIKKYKGKMNGNADIFVAPRIETANALYKSLQHYIHAEMGGILYGTDSVIIHPSRSDDPKTKYFSLLLGLSTYANKKREY